MKLKPKDNQSQTAHEALNTSQSNTCSCLFLQYFPWRRPSLPTRRVLLTTSGFVLLDLNQFLLKYT